MIRFYIGILAVVLASGANASFFKLEFSGALDRINSIQVNDPDLESSSPYSQGDSVVGRVRYEVDRTRAIDSPNEAYYPVVSEYEVKVGEDRLFASAGYVSTLLITEEDPARRVSGLIYSVSTVPFVNPADSIAGPRLGELPITHLTLYFRHNERALIDSLDLPVEAPDLEGFTAEGENADARFTIQYSDETVGPNGHFFVASLNEVTVREVSAPMTALLVAFGLSILILVRRQAVRPATITS